MTNFKYVLATLVAVIFTWILHEFSHWTAGELLGNDMVMTLNGCYPKSGQYLENRHATIVSAAGPIVTLIQAIVFYFLLKVKSEKLLFPFLLTCLYMRFLAGVMNFINPNDEGRISTDLGLGLFTLSILMVGVLFYLTYAASKAKGFRVKFVVSTILLIMLFSSVIILSDQALGVKILS
jgi:hypothetical protein